MQMIDVISSNIAAIGYSPVDKLLRVRFHSGRTYEYEGVPQNVAQTLQDADSVGRVFNAAVKDRYPFTEI